MFFLKASKFRMEQQKNPFIFKQKKLQLSQIKSLLFVVFVIMMKI